MLRFVNSLCLCASQKSLVSEFRRRDEGQRLIVQFLLFDIVFVFLIVQLLFIFRQGDFDFIRAKKRISHLWRDDRAPDALARSCTRTAYRHAYSCFLATQAKSASTRFLKNSNLDFIMAFPQAC